MENTCAEKDNKSNEGPGEQVLYEVAEGAAVV